MAAGAAVAVNLLTFLSFRRDKQRAVVGGRRIPERRLLGLALLGGTPAAFAARAMLRHNTRKQPFSAWLTLIAAAQAGLLLAFAL
ncbi:MAG: DUF1294 domain-containing protein [Sphingomonas sp.]